MSSGAPEADRSSARRERGPNLTVAVLNYNGRALLEEILPSLARQTLSPSAIVVVDNCSEDDSIAYLRTNWPQVRVVRLPTNRGVTSALNACLAASDTELTGLFNNDMELAPDCLCEMVAELDCNPLVGSVTPKMLDFVDRTVIDGAGDMLSWRGGGRRRGHGERDAGQYDHAEEVFGPCGGAAVYRRSALEAVGNFDEAYYAYYEDIDWAFRAQLAGFRCRYVPSAVLYHRGSATIGRGMTDFNGYHLWRNPIWLVAKCFPAGALVRHAPDLLRGQAGNLYVALRERKGRVWFRAMVDALRGLPGALRKRRAVQRTRVITLAELETVARVPRR
ncbi:MAG: glycosyltransferase family 2 protein [Solirubrobacterales bacterium]